MTDTPEQIVIDADDSDVCRLDIMFVARQLGSADDSDGEAAASERGWIDAVGEVTPAGREVVEALKGQAHTRSVFRSFG
ncbi:MAG: hypothetical protein QNJ67_08145 [Kiloniellales bacterium]|nr:hypothetical protein [Kiloniellales bacterium]